MSFLCRRYLCIHTQLQRVPSPQRDATQHGDGEGQGLLQRLATEHHWLWLHVAGDRGLHLCTGLGGCSSAST